MPTFKAKNVPIFSANHTHPVNTIEICIFFMHKMFSAQKNKLHDQINELQTNSSE